MSAAWRIVLYKRWTLRAQDTRQGRRSNAASIDDGRISLKTVFSAGHPPQRLASRRPVWSDMTSDDTIMQWREDWSPASVVNHTLLLPTLLSDSQVSISLVILVSSRQVKAHVVLTCTNVVSPNRLPVIVASDSGAAAEIAQDLMHAGPTAANPQQRRRRANDGTCRQTDRRADTVPLHRPSCGYYASSVYSVDYDSMACSLTSSCPTRW